MIRVKELIGYSISGGISTLFNLLCYYLFLRVGMNYIYANTLSYVIAVLLNYAINRKAVFAKGELGIIESLVRFIIVRVGVLAIDNVLLTVAVEKILLDPFFSKIGISFFEILITFIINKIWVFK